MNVNSLGLSRSRAQESRLSSLRRLTRAPQRPWSRNDGRPVGRWGGTADSSGRKYIRVDPRYRRWHATVNRLGEAPDVNSQGSVRYVTRENGAFATHAVLTEKLFRFDAND
jgi:hypothetical protein